MTGADARAIFNGADGQAQPRVELCAGDEVVSGGNAGAKQAHPARVSKHH